MVQALWILLILILSALAYYGIFEVDAVICSGSFSKSVYQDNFYHVDVDLSCHFAGFGFGKYSVSADERYGCIESSGTYWSLLRRSLKTQAKLTCRENPKEFSITSSRFFIYQEEKIVPAVVEKEALVLLYGQTAVCKTGFCEHTSRVLNFNKCIANSGHNAKVRNENAAVTRKFTRYLFQARNNVHISVIDTPGATKTEGETCEGCFFYNQTIVDSLLQGHYPQGWNLDETTRLNSKGKWIMKKPTLILYFVTFQSIQNKFQPDEILMNSAVKHEIPIVFVITQADNEYPELRTKFPNIDEEPLKSHKEKIIQNFGGHNFKFLITYKNCFDPSEECADKTVDDLLSLIQDSAVIMPTVPIPPNPTWEFLKRIRDLPVEILNSDFFWKICCIILVFFTFLRNIMLNRHR